LFVLFCVFLVLFCFVFIFCFVCSILFLWSYFVLVVLFCFGYITLFWFYYIVLVVLFGLGSDESKPVTPQNNRRVSCLFTFWNKLSKAINSWRKWRTTSKMPCSILVVFVFCVRRQQAVQCTLAVCYFWVPR